MHSISEAARQIRQEESDRARLYQRFSPIVGAFDASEMSAADIAAHSLKKLGLKVPTDDRAKLEAANCFLAGRQETADRAAGHRGAMDSGAGNTVVDRYIRGES